MLRPRIYYCTQLDYLKSTGWWPITARQLASRSAYHLYPKKRFFRIKCQVEWFNPVKIFRNKRNTFKGIPPFFPFSQNDQDKLYHLQKSHSCHSLTHGQQLCEPGTSRPSLLSSIGSFLTNGTASYFDPFLTEEINRSICPQNPTRKFHANGKRSCILWKILLQDVRAIWF